MSKNNKIKKSFDRQDLANYLLLAPFVILFLLLSLTKAQVCCNLMLYIILQHQTRCRNILIHKGNL